MLRVERREPLEVHIGKYSTGMEAQPQPSGSSYRLYGRLLTD